MRPANQIEIMFLVKLSDHIFSKSEADSSIVVAVGLDAAFGV